MRILTTVTVGVVVGAIIVSSQLNVEGDSPWNLEDATLAGAVRLEAASDCAELTTQVRAVANRLAEAGESAYAGGGPVILEDFSSGDAVVGAPQVARAETAPVTAEPAAGGAGGDDGGTRIAGTNIQEAGVDEADVIKTDGSTIFVLRDGALVAVDAATLDELDVLRWKDRYPYDMLLAGDRIVIFESAWREPKASGDGAESDRVAPEYYGGEPILRMTIVDVSDPSALETAEVVEVDGGLVAARLVDGFVRVVSSSAPNYYWGGPEPTILRGEVAVDAIGHAPSAATPDEVTAEDVLPTITVAEPDGSTVSYDLPCQQVYVAPEAETLESTTVFSLDPNDPKPVGEATALAGAGTVYANPRSIYVARQLWTRRGGERTEVHRFDISDPSQTRYVSAGAVPGYLINQFSMSEHDERLRVATTTNGTQENDFRSESQVSILRERGDRLVTIGSVGGLGLDERIFAVRFIGDLGYVVTFRQIDPLYVLDLSDPQNPTVQGELKIPGYSAYLHPVADGFLVGVGQDADRRGRTLGVQVSLFDVRDPSNPRQVAKLTGLGDYTAVESDHRAFQFLSDRNLVIVPASSWGAVAVREAPAPDDLSAPDGGSDGPAPDGGSDGPTPDGGGDVSASPPVYEEPKLRSTAYLIEVTPDGLRQVGEIRHGALASSEPRDDVYRMGEISRSIAIDDTLFTLSDAGLTATDLDSLRRLAALPW